MALSAFVDGQVVHDVDLNGVGFGVYLSGTQSIPDGTETTIKHTVVVEDPDGGYNTSTGKYTVASAGLWVFTASVNWPATATVWGLHLIGTNDVWNWASQSVTGGRVNVAMVMRMAVGQTVYVNAFQVSGAPMNVQASTVFAGARLAA